MRTLRQINAVCEKIIQSDMPNRVKTHKLTKLMTEMEKKFQIPLTRNEHWERENEAISALYRKLWRWRDL